MTSKIRGFLILNFLLSILILSVLISIVSAADTQKNFNIPIYIQTSAGLQEADYDDIVEILFNHNFEVQEKQEIVADEKCSLRAKVGSLEIDSKIFDKNDLSFYIPLKNDGAGKGSLTTQKDRDRFSLSFEVTKILETNSEKLVFEVKGKGKLNREELNFDNIIVTFDKTNNLVDITGTGDKNFQATGLEVTFTEGCLSEEQKFYLLIDNGLLGKGRSANEVVQILKKDPIFLDVYWNLEKLHKQYWWIHIPNVHPGSIWTTNSNCGSYEQNISEYNIGEYVYINGANFKPGEYDWAITGMPGQASCDPNIAVAIGSLTVNETGAFCFNAYQVQEGDCKEYQVNFNSKYDNYTIIPEFNNIIGILTLASAVGVFFVIRRK